MKSVESLFLNKEHLDHFEATKLVEKPNEWIVTAIEKKELIPKELE
ncbi:MAG: hypothetical protein H8E98_03655 [Bacteroidetes bacterium]|nr:hypothetical protein [Bacteroidota bacterium]